MTVTQTSPSIVEVTGSGKTLKLLLLSDLHWDNAHCERALLKRHLTEAVAQCAGICLFGDTFCAMQGKWDRRKDEAQLRPEHRGGDYFNKLVDTAADWFAPFAENLLVVSYGNHETSILQHNNYDLLQGFTQRLRFLNPKFRGVIGAYAGFLEVRLPRSAAKEKTNSCVIYWDHGSGGGGEVTRGMIDNNRTRGMIEGADVYISGHIHRRNMDENVVLRYDRQNKSIHKRTEWFLRSGCYKTEDGSNDNNLSGWHVEKGRRGRPLGGWWLDVEVRSRHQSHDITVTPRVAT